MKLEDIGDVICIKTHVKYCNSYGNSLNLELTKMKMYNCCLEFYSKEEYIDYTKKFKVYNNDVIEDFIIYSIVNNDDIFQVFQYSETDFKKYFSTEIVKFQRTEGLKKIGKVSKNNNC